MFDATLGPNPELIIFAHLPLIYRDRRNSMTKNIVGIQDNIAQVSLKIHLLNNLRFYFHSCIWAVALLAMGSFLVYTTYEQFTAYFKYTTLTNTQVQARSTIQFPAVTLCSVSSLKKENLPNISDLEYYFLTESVIGPFFPKLDLNKPEYADYRLPRNASWVRDTANPIEDLFLFCFFEGEDEECKKVMKPTVTKLGVCYTFNSREHVKENGHTVTSRTGSTSGLRLYLWVNQTSFVFNDIMAAGIKVIGDSILVLMNTVNLPKRDQTIHI